ncbi:hypothetical protein [Microbacterium sp. LWH11-1.2]|uniref:hypothetical protein n=1 Tax=Microbacterium sp. LWH11-1.2 TaxID=3135258 RepID=UPI00313A2D88
MTKLDIYLKSGAVIALDLEEFSITRSSVTGEVNKVTWTSGKSKPLYISPADIVAVIEK